MNSLRDRGGSFYEILEPVGMILRLAKEENRMAVAMEMLDEPGGG
jgi:hypothetical protein